MEIQWKYNGNTIEIQWKYRAHGIVPKLKLFQFVGINFIR